VTTTLKIEAKASSNRSDYRLAHQAILNQIKSYFEKEILDDADHSLLAAFAYSYYQNSSLETLQSCSIEELAKIAKEHWALSYQRPRGTSKIHIYNPTEENLWAKYYTVILIATDDMPFIVDSLNMSLRQQGLTIHFTIHLGNLWLKRSAVDNRILSILPRIDLSNAALHSAQQEGPNTHSIYPEALVYIIIDRQPSAEVLNKLQTTLHTILAEARAAVSDWPKMRARMLTCLTELEKKPPPYHKEDFEESKKFLAWLLDNNFIFLGCRDYLLKDKKAWRIIKSSSLGVLRDESRSSIEKSLIELPPEARELALSPQILVFSTTNTKARIHRSVYTEYIAVKQFSTEGKLIGECRFIGLYTSSVYRCDALTIPLVRRKINWALTQSQFPRDSHLGKVLLDILVNLPRVELLQASAALLLSLATDMLSLQGKPAIRLFIRQDSYQRFMSCLVYIPQEKLTTALQKKIEVILMQAFAGLEFSFETVLGESPLARIHFLIRTRPKKIPTYDVHALEEKIIAIARSWQEHLALALKQQYPQSVPILLPKYQEAFSISYQETRSAQAAVTDIRYIEKLSSLHNLEMDFYQLCANKHKVNSIPQLRFRLFQLDQPIILSNVLAVLEKMGLQVMDEWPTEVRPAHSSSVWIHDFGLQPLTPCDFDFELIKPLFQEAFQRIWQGEAENDSFNQLVLTAGLSWKEVVLLRAYTKYMRQIGTPFSQPYVETALVQNTRFVRLLIELFQLRLDPKQAYATHTSMRLHQLEKELEKSLESVTSLDEDRILRQLWELIRATLRSNFFQERNVNQRPRLSFKLNSNTISALPLPRPLYEIFVYSPQMEGVHLRAGKVARGGLRWSDRREDFRTEILGLMKAQQVKNAVIVPAGAKGGFVYKALSLNIERSDSLQQQVIYCYQDFIRGLLDITDNIQEGVIVPPPNVVRYDGDDPYLVVAADKGTATFSDIANQIAAEYRFWLGDAFASGGSQGYDHKKIGITARGAWESVKCHFHELGLHPDRDDFTCVGIGDMSGDVFGNGMLLSRHTKLVAAFNHLHIFIDPSPDPEKSFLERKRLFDLPRSSWLDYNARLLSKGGGIFNRNQKSLLLTPEIQSLLELSVSSISPDALIRAILTASVDLLWNGGIGTYVKAHHERHTDVGDKSNDMLRVDGNQLRCRMVCEGGNLGFTQLGRIEYALKGGHIYTDFIDNSAGVDCSDHEVNCKILLNTAVMSHELTLTERNQLLASMTDEIAQLVLTNNYHQTRAITLATLNSKRDIALYRGYLNSLEREGHLDRVLEYLPDNQSLAERKVLGQGLATPEISILLAYTKMQIKAQLLQLPDSQASYMLTALSTAFPRILQEKYSQHMRAHSLRREIIATNLSNRIVNEMGPVFFYRMKLETGVGVDTIVRAYLVTRQVLNLDQLTQSLAKLSENLSLTTYAHRMQQLNRLIRHTVRWFIQHYRGQLQEINLIAQQFIQPITQLQQSLPKWLKEEEQMIQWQQTETMLKAEGIPTDVARQIAYTEQDYVLLDVVEIASKHAYSLKNVLLAYLMTSTHFEFSWLRAQIRRQNPDTHWDTIARAALLDDLDTQQCRLTVAFLRFSLSVDQPKKTLIENHWAAWQAHHAEFSQRWQHLLADLRSTAELKLMVFSIAIRSLNALICELVDSG
jgi:glutamate dehydrogenase